MFQTSLCVSVIFMEISFVYPMKRMTYINNLKESQMTQVIDMGILAMYVAAQVYWIIKLLVFFSYIGSVKQI